MNNKNITLLHPKGKGQISLSIEALGLSNDKGNYVVRYIHKNDTQKAHFDSFDDASINLRRRVSHFITAGYFLPLPRNLSDMVDYDKSKWETGAEGPSWNTTERMPIDRAFFNDNYVRELYDGHHVMIKLSPSETQPFSMWDGRGTYSLSDTLLSKLSMLHAYLDIKGLTLNTTMTHNGDIVINEVIEADNSSNAPVGSRLEEMKARALNTPLRFLRFATRFSTPEEWHQRTNIAAYASFKKYAQFASRAIRYHFPSGRTYRVIMKTLYELHAESEKGSDEIVLCLSQTPFISQLEIGERFVADGRRIYTQPMFDNLRIFTP